MNEVCSFHFASLKPRFNKTFLASSILSSPKLKNWPVANRKLQIVTIDDVQRVIGKGDEKIQILEYAPKKLLFHVNSTEANIAVPILIKISYFPNWKAYVDGKEAKIYKASPYLMLVYGKGNIELRYEKLLVDWLGIIFTILGVIYILVEMIR